MDTESVRDIDLVLDVEAESVEGAWSAGGGL